MIGPKVFRMSRHQNKEQAFKSALKSRGWHENQYTRSSYVRFGLFDADWRKEDIDGLKGKPYFLYPHAARPMVQYDGCVTPRKDCRTMFVSAPAGVYLMEKIGYPCEVVEVGWGLTEIKDFQPREQAKHICFAPIHPNANGYLNEVDKKLNRAAYVRILDYAERNDAEVKVRFCGLIEDNGLEKEFSEKHERVIWKTGIKDSSTDDIKQADLVVSHQTFAYMAVALGVPTVMIGEDVAPRSGNQDDIFTYSAHFEDYRDYLAFPLDILNGEPEKVISKAISTDEPIKDWRDHFIGHPFDPDYFVDCIESRM